MTPFIGVRISWLIVARNSDFSREASMAWSRASASSAAARSRSATRPSWVAIWSMRSREFVVGRHLVAEHCDHAGDAAAVPDRERDQAVGGLVPGDGSCDDLAGRPTPAGQERGRATMPRRRRSRVEHQRHQLGSSSPGRKTQSALPARASCRRPPRRAAASRPGWWTVGRLGDLPQQGQPAGVLADLVVGHHLVGDVLVGAVHAHRPCRRRRARPGRGRGTSARRRRRGSTGRSTRTRRRRRTSRRPRPARPRGRRGG